jgi:hypothetical protein
MTHLIRGTAHTLDPAIAREIQEWADAAVDPTEIAGRLNARGIRLPERPVEHGAAGEDWCQVAVPVLEGNPTRWHVGAVEAVLGQPADGAA